MLTGFAIIVIGLFGIAAIMVVSLGEVKGKNE